MSAHDETPSAQNEQNEQNEALADLSETRVTSADAEQVRGGFTAVEHKPQPKAIEISDYSFDIEQVLNIGS
jgi:hypothetical protein